MEFCHLPPLSRESGFCPVGKNSPRARERAPQQDSSKITPVKRQRDTPRPLPLQRLAAQLAVRCRGLDRGHIGALCDALDTAGIDPQHWTARQLTDALNDDMRTRGWSWPDRIERPGGFLVSRLRRLTDGGKAAGLDKNPRPAAPTPTPPQYIPEDRPPLTPEQQARIAEIRAGIRAQLTARQPSVSRSVNRPAMVCSRDGLRTGEAAAQACPDADMPKERDYRGHVHRSDEDGRGTVADRGRAQLRGPQIRRLRHDHAHCEQSADGPQSFGQRQSPAPAATTGSR